MVLKIEGWTREGEKGNTLKERKVALQKKKRRRRWTTNRLKKYLGLENVLGWKKVLGWTEKGFGLKQKHFGLKKVLGWKKGFGLNWKRFWVEAKTFWAGKKKGNTSTEKKKWGAKDKRKEHWTKAEKGALTRKEKRTRKVWRWTKRREVLKEKRKGWNKKKKRAELGGQRRDIFSAFIFFQIFSEKLWWICLCWI